LRPSLTVIVAASLRGSSPITSAGVESSWIALILRSSVAGTEVSFGWEDRAATKKPPGSGGCGDVWLLVWWF
jgi:hypothetical protein